MFTIGTYMPELEAEMRIQCDDPDLSRHINRPWFRAYAEERLGRALTNDAPASPVGDAVVEGSELARHACVCGSSGSGKTRLALHLLAEQLRAGCSVVMLDPKAQTIEHLLQMASAAGVPAGNVTVLRPDTLGSGAPGWNPLSGEGGIPPEQAAADVVSVLAHSAPGSWGYRLQDLLTNALIVIAAHRLSLFELARFLQRDDYRMGLLSIAPDDGILSDAEAYDEAAHFFAHEFSRWGPAERASAVAPVVNKFREMLRSPFLRAVLCARRTTFDLADLWQRQSILAVHLDEAGLGDEGTRLLGGLLTHQLYRTALRASGPVPVVLCLDEMGVAEEFIGGAAAKILAIARSQNLRLLVACQHLAQLSDGLRSALLANTAVRAFFRLGYDDARLVASWLAAGTGERINVIRADPPARGRVGETPDQASVAHTLCDGYGTPMELSGPAWSAFSGFRQGVPGDQQIGALRQLADLSGIGRLYVQAPDTGKSVELLQYLRGIRSTEFSFTGPAPVRLIISFPRPRLSVSSKQSETERGQRWLRTLMELPVRHAVLRPATGVAGVIKVTQVSDPSSAEDIEYFMQGAAHFDQSAEEVAAVLRWRKAGVEQVAESLTPMAPSQSVSPQHSNVPQHSDVPRSNRQVPTPAGQVYTPERQAARGGRKPATINAKPAAAKAASNQASGQLRSPTRKPRPKPSTDTVVGEDGNLA